MTSKNMFSALAEEPVKIEVKSSFANELNKKNKVKLVQKPKEVLKEFEIQLIRNVYKAKVESEITHFQKEFEKWSRFYFTELEEMYEMFVERTLTIPFEDFALLAFNCTKTEFDINRFRSYKLRY